MKFKSILLTAVATISLATATMAQVPNYVPTNGLVGWWPFNGNANDESGNGNNGAVNGATLTYDRYGNTNSAYSFDGATNSISIPHSNSIAITSNITISVWKKSNGNTGNYETFVNKRGGNGEWNYSLGASHYFGPGGCPQEVDKYVSARRNNGGAQYELKYTDYLVSNDLNNWTNVIVSINSDTVKFFINGNLVGNSCFGNIFTIPSIDVQAPLTFGSCNCGLAEWFHGTMDDIGIWNRALNQQEITNLYTSTNCASNTTITPQTNSLATASTATFTATSSDPNPSYVWQSDFGQGYVALNNYGNYSGANTANLNISNVQLSEHNQPIRVITTSGNCIDTSNVALINILDTCIVTIYDTLLTAVTDTLVINTQITGINPPNNLNTLKVFPNPANDHITINYGNFASMSGYTLKIVNSVGQTVFTTPINQQTSYIDLSTWTGNGIYFVQLIDPLNSTIENRKIVIQ
jgi:hypothetical protein